MTQNAVRPLRREDTQPPRTVLRAVPREESNTDRSNVVAEILSDGTVRPVTSSNGEAASKAWSEGSISGRSWILWWTRRSFSQA